MGKFKEMDLLRQEREAFDADYPMEPTPRAAMWIAWNSEDGFTLWDNEYAARLCTATNSIEWPVQYVMQKVNIQTQIVKDNLQPAPVQEPVAWISPNGSIHFDPWLDSVPLYTTPPAQTGEECAAILYRDHNEEPWVHVIQKDLPSGTKLVAITKGQP